MRKSLCAAAIGIVLSTSCLAVYIHPNGYWIGEDAVKEHIFDANLAEAIADFFEEEGAKTIVDFGCGTGEYVKAFHNRGLDCEGFDGNPDTPSLSGGVAKVLDLSFPFDLLKRYDWVLSLEVGEHLHKDCESYFISNLHRHNVKGIVLSWAVKGQGGFGHFNEQNNDYIKNIMANYGYVNDVEAENALRRASTLSWFKNTLMVFRK